jgi:uncharacterized protein (TIGR02147 family)
MTEKKYIFDYRHYKPYLLAVCGGKTMKRGLKAELAKAAECQPTYISQVLHGKAHLSPEQGERITRYLKLGKEESEYFLLLLHHDRAGTTELKSFYRTQIEERIVARMNVVNRLGPNNILTEEQHAIYYSSWHYAALHVALSVPELRTVEALARHFNLRRDRIEKVLQFLVEAGLANQTKNIYTIGAAEVLLGKHSPHIVKHHTHWRQQAIESLEEESASELHYSGVMTLAKNDVLKLKERMLEQIKNNVDLIRESKEEEVYVICMDLFTLNKEREG